MWEWTPLYRKDISEGEGPESLEGLWGAGQVTLCLANMWGDFQISESSLWLLRPCHMSPSLSQPLLHT